MRAILVFSMSFFFITSLSAQNHAPVVSNVAAHQRTGTKFVDITYDVDDADGDALLISVRASADSGRTFAIAPATFIPGSAVGVGISPGTGKIIVWEAGKDCPFFYKSAFQVMVIADDGKSRVVTVNDGYGEYVLVPAGPFIMGDNSYNGYPSTTPVHSVTLDSFYIGKYEVTNAEFKKFIDDGGYKTRAFWTAGGFGTYGNQPYLWDDPAFYGGKFSGNENYPVLSICWNVATAYCNWLSSKTGKVYRLPTEAEWEKAARGDSLKNIFLGHQRIYPWGDNIDLSYANYTLVPRRPVPVGYYDGSTHGSFVTHSNASPYGAYDMAGNCWELCYDLYKSNDVFRVIRGGGFGHEAYELTTVRRGYDDPATGRGYSIGFRCVREY